MPEAPKSTSLLSRVQSRLKVNSLARALFVSGLVVVGVSFAVLLVIRLMGLVPQSQENPLWLLSIPGLMIVSALLFHRRVGQQSAARAVDSHARTKDLFLTLSSLHTSAGEYQPLVTQSAEDKADQIHPTEVVPFQFAQRLLVMVGVVGVFAVTAVFLPQFDPLGRVEAAAKTENQQKEMESIRKTNKERAKALTKKKIAATESKKMIEERIEKLKKDFRTMKPDKKQANTRVLGEHRMDLSEKWLTAAASEQFRRMLKTPMSGSMAQSARKQKMNEWMEELKEGKADKLKEQLKQAAETAKQMAEAETPAEKRELANKLQEQLQDLQKFARDKAGSKELNDALKKAMTALKAAKENNGEEATAEQKKLAKKAMEALKDSLKLSEQEMQQLEDAAKEMKRLDEALETLRQAEKLNAQNQLDGGKCDQCESLEDYKELYSQLMQEGQGASDQEKDVNEGGEGQGRGGASSEDDTEPEGYVDEQEHPQVAEGRILLSMKTKEYAENEEVDPNEYRKYAEAQQRLKGAVQSAIETEDIPPQYVDGIKGYFDKLEKADPTPKK